MIKRIIGGLAGAIALTIAHETIKHFEHKSPRIDLIGEEALQKGMARVGVQPLTGQQLYVATLAGDLVSNALYYSLIGKGKPKFMLLRGVLYGAAAGLGALQLTRPLGLNDAPVNRFTETQAMTVAYYTLGGIVAAFTMKGMRFKTKVRLLKNL